MVQLILFTFICYGWANIMVHSSIFESWREFWVKVNPNFFGKLFTCMMCLPFWIGVLISTFFYSITTEFGLANGYFAIFLDACLASGLTWFIHTIQEYFEK